MSEESFDELFRALADPTRREIIDLLQEQPGQNVSELTEHFEVTRYAIMKHLKTLEEGNLVVSRREGRSRRLYVNPMPLQTMYERWLSRYSAAVASGLAAFQRELEEEEKPMAGIEHVFELYIQATPERVWRALTDPDETVNYYFGTRVESDFEPGSPLRYRHPDGKVGIEGEIVEAEPPERLVHTFDFPHNDDPSSQVVFELEAMGENLTKLTVIHEAFDEENETYHSVSDGWPKVLNGLKTYVETGESLRFSDSE